jgi:hypothetical protein
MREVAVDARDKINRVTQFKVVTTILDAEIDGGQIARLYERRWSGEVDNRSIKSVMQMDILRCKTPEMVEKEIWTHLLAYNLLRTVMAVAASENGIVPCQVSFKGAKQVVTAFAPKIEAARPKDRAALISEKNRMAHGLTRVNTSTQTSFCMGSRLIGQFSLPTDLRRQQMVILSFSRR